MPLKSNAPGPPPPPLRSPKFGGEDEVQWERKLNWIVAILLPLGAILATLFLQFTSPSPGSDVGSSGGSAQTESVNLDDDASDVHGNAEHVNAGAAGVPSSGANAKSIEAEEQSGVIADANQSVDSSRSESDELVGKQIDTQTAEEIADGEIQNLNHSNLPRLDIHEAPLRSSGRELVSRSGKNPFMGEKGTELSTVFVVDVSGSMQMPDRLPRVKGSLAKAIERLTATQKFSVLMFSDSMIESPLGIDMVYANKSNKSVILKWLEQPIGGGGTRPRDAMVQAITLQPERIVLLSDGEFDVVDMEEIIAMHRSKNPRSRIDCIGLMETVITLQQIASRCRGIYYEAK